MMQEIGPGTYIIICIFYFYPQYSSNDFLDSIAVSIPACQKQVIVVSHDATIDTHRTREIWVRFPVGEHDIFFVFFLGF